MCRSDGTTGLIVGGMAGGVLGSIICPGGSKTVGAILGAGDKGTDWPLHRRRRRMLLTPAHQRCR